MVTVLDRELEELLRQLLELAEHVVEAGVLNRVAAPVGGRDEVEQRLAAEEGQVRDRQIPDCSNMKSKLFRAVSSLM